MHRERIFPDETTLLGPTPVTTTSRAADLAYPHVRLAIEYDGAEHRTQRRARRDLIREAALTALGWHILRFDADVALFRPDRLVQAVGAELAARGA